MATLVGQGFIEIIPKLSSGFGPQLEAQLMGGTKTAAASAVKAAETGGTQAGSAFATNMGKAAPAMETSLAGGTKTAAASAVKNAESGGLQAGTSFATNLGKAAPAMETGLAGGTKSAAASAVTAAETGGLQAGSSFASSVGKAAPALESELTTGTTSAATAAITAAEQGGMQAGSQFATAVGNASPEIESGLVTGTTSAATAAATAAETGGTEAGTQFASGVGAAAADIETELVDGTSTATASAASAASAGGTEAGSSFATGLGGAANEIETQLVDGTSAATASAATEAGTGGADAGASFATGISSAAADIESNLDEAVNTAAASAASEAGTGGADAGTSFAEGITSAADSISSNLVDATSEAGADAATVAGEGGADAGGSFADGLSSAAGEIGERLKSGVQGGSGSAEGAAGEGGAAAGVAFVAHMRESLAGLGPMMKTILGAAVIGGIVEFVNSCVGGFQQIVGESLKLQRVMGGTIEQASEWRAVADRYGVSADGLATAMKGLSRNVETNSPAFRELGIQTRNAHGDMLPMGDILMSLADRFHTMPDGVGKTRLATQLFGRAGLDLLPVLNQGRDGLQRVIDKARDYGIILDDSAIPKAKALKESQWDVKASAEGVKDAIGEKLAPVITSFNNFLADHLIPALGAVWGWLDKNKAIVGPLAIAVGIYAGAAGAAAAATWAWNAALAANPVVVIAGAIAACTWAVIQLGLHWDEAWKKIKDNPAYIIVSIAMHKLTLPIYAVVAACNYLADHWDGIWAGMKTAWNIAWTWLSGIPGKLMGWAVNAAVWLITAGWNIIDGLWKGMRLAWNSLWAWLSNLPNQLQRWGMTALGWLLNTGWNIIQGLWNGMKFAWNLVWGWVSGIPGQLARWGGKALGWLLDTGHNIISGLWNGMKFAWSLAWGWITNIPNTLKNWGASAVTWLVQTGHDIIGSWDGYTGLLGGMHKAWDWITELPGKIKDALVQVFTDPLGFLFDVGKQIGQGLINGIKSLWPGNGEGGSINLPGMPPIPIPPLPFAAGGVTPYTGTFLVGERGPELVRLPRLALGGNILNGGAAIVGENGPELVGLPGGSTVYPNSKLTSSAGPDLIAGLLGGMTSTVRNSGATIKRDITDPLIKYFTDAFGIASPSKLTTRYGVELIDGLTKGMSDRLPQINRSTGDIVGRFNTVSSGASRVVGQVGVSVDQYRAHVGGMAAVTESVTGRVIRSHGVQSGAVTLLASTNVARTSAINAASLGMAGVTEISGKRVGAAHGTQGAAVSLLQAVHGTRTGQINAANLGMASHTETVTGRVRTQHAGQIASVTNLATIHGGRTGAINLASLGMAANTDQTTSRINTQHLSHVAGLNNLAATHGLRTSTINLASLGMATNTDQTTSRINTQHLSHVTGLNNLAATHGQRTGQINTAALGMAGTTETSTTRVKNAYVGMQKQVDALHGKSINVSSLAGVTYQPDAVLTKNLAHAIGVLTSAGGSTGGFAVGQPVANGAIFNRSRVHGAIDSLPEQAIISGAKGPGLVQWAEAETGGESFIPLAPGKRRRSLEIWRETGKILGAFATGGLLDIVTSLDTDSWDSRTARLQTLADRGATQLGKTSSSAMSKAAGKVLADTVYMALVAAMAPKGTGFSMSGTWAASIRPWVEYIARSLNISAMTYGDHHPSSGTAADLALGQAGMKNTAPKIGPSGTDLYSRVADWVDKHVISAPSPGWYVGVHAGIKNRGGGWHAISSQTGRRGQTFAHDDHVHVSFDPRGVSDLGVLAHNFSVPGYNWDHGHGAPKVSLLPPGGLPNIFGSSGGKGKWSQAQMEAALRAAGAPANVAHLLGAIAMAETGGWNFPTWNSVAGGHWYHGPWAFQDNTIAGMGLNPGALDSNLALAAQAAYRLYLSPTPGGVGVNNNQWEVVGRGSYAQYMGQGGVRSYDAGGMLPPGLSLAYNGTGKPEPVGGGNTVQHNIVNLTLNVANGDPVTVKTAAQQAVDEALTTLARRLASGAGRN